MHPFQQLAESEGEPARDLAPWELTLGKQISCTGFTLQKRLP